MADWEVGDLALCVDASEYRCQGKCLHTGTRCPPIGSLNKVLEIAVARVEFGSLTGRPCGCISLIFADRMHGVARRFRKIRPDEHQACEPDFVTLLKRSKKQEPALGYLVGKAVGL